MYINIYKLHQISNTLSKHSLRYYTPLISFYSKNKATHQTQEANSSHNVDEILHTNLFPPTKLSQQQIDTINDGFYQKDKILYTGKNTVLKGKPSRSDKSTKKRSEEKESKK